MGRGRGKGKKQTSIAAKNDAYENNEVEEKIPASKRRGRPQKPVNDEINQQDEDEKIIEEDENPPTSKDTKDHITVDNWKKRKRSSSSAVKESSDSIKEDEDSYGSSKPSDDSNLINKSVGFRSNGNRRKSSKPHRAAEVGVECN